MIENSPDSGSQSSDQALNRGIAAYKQVLNSQKDNEAQNFLRETLGTEKTDALYKKAPKTNGNAFDFLENFTARQLNLFFRNESPAAVALVLSRLPSKMTASVLANTGPELKAELIRRIARMGETSTEVLERVAAAMREKAARFTRTLESEDDVEIDGVAALTAILKASGADFGDKLIGELAVDAPGLSRSIKEKLFTLEDIRFVPDRVMEEKLRTMTDNEILLLLNNQVESFKQKIIDNLSEGRIERIEDEAKYLEPTARIEIEAAARDFLTWFRVTGPWVEEGENK